MSSSSGDAAIQALADQAYGALVGGDGQAHAGTKADPNVVSQAAFNDYSGHQAYEARHGRRLGQDVANGRAVVSTDPTHAPRPLTLTSAQLNDPIAHETVNHLMGGTIASNIRSGRVVVADDASGGE